MRIIEAGIPGVLLIEPRVFEDQRGFFLETWNQDRYRLAGFPDVDFVQDNHSRSRRGVLRGMHFQLRHPQGKLLQVARGSVFNVSVDIRRGSPSFGRWVGYELTDANHRQLWVPPGFAHGFCVLSESVDLIYKCTDFYRPEDEMGLLWNDPDIGVAWPVDQPLLSAKDEHNPRLADLPDASLPVYR